MLKRILFVDDEPNILQAIERQFHKEFTIATAAGPAPGLRMINEQGPFAVVVSDLRMPEMDGIAFLARVRAICPDSVRVMLTGQADLDAAVAAVNRGNIFQFLTKPCPPDILKQVLNAALEQYRLITAERELLEQTLRGSIAVLADILSLVNPAAFGRAQRIRRYVVHIAERLGMSDRWQFEVAAMMSQVGSVTVPPDLMDKYSRMEPLSEQESGILAAQSRIGFDLLVRIPRLDMVARMVARQEAPASQTADEPQLAATGAQLLKVARNFDEQIMRGADPCGVLAEMARNRAFNPKFVAALHEVHIEEARLVSRLVRLGQLRTHMILDRDVFSKNGLLLLAKGQEITESALARLKNFAQTIGVAEPLSVVTQSLDRAEDDVPVPSAAFSEN